MKILITGAGGFVGQMVTEALLAETSEAHTLILTDMVEIPAPRSPNLLEVKEIERTDEVEEEQGGGRGGSGGNEGKCLHRVRLYRCDLLNDGMMHLVSPDLDAAILLHGIMSAGAEANFERGYRVNVNVTWTLLDQLIKVRGPGVRVLYASSLAVFYGGPARPEHHWTEDDLPTPELSYGCQKLMCETLINDYTRRGLIDGFALRFPTISVRPGKPSPAVTAFLSGIIREPMNGIECVLPVNDRKWRHWTSSPRTTVGNIMVALRLPRDALLPHKRAINMPGFAVTIQQMLDALETVGGKDKLKWIREEDKEGDTVLPLLTKVFDNSLAISLGMRQDSSFIESVKEYADSLHPA